jgi:DNA polymerase
MFVPKHPEPDPAFRVIVREHKADILAYLDSSQPVFLDVETRSRASLPDLGGRRYAADPTTQLLSCVAAVDERIVLWTPGCFSPAVAWPAGHGPERPIETHSCTVLPPILTEAIAAGRPICAHNALGFERWIWRAKQLPEPIRWIDTIPWARSAGCPASLDAAACWLLGKAKDATGKALIKRYCSPCGKAKKFREFRPEDWRALLTYNLIDVLLLEQLYPILRSFDREPEVLALDRVINERGMRLDTDLMKRLLALNESEVQTHLRQVLEITNGRVTESVISSPKQLIAYLKEQGVAIKAKTGKGADSLNKDEVKRILRSEPPEAIRAVLLARQAYARAGEDKIRAGLDSVDNDGRIRHQLVYHKAHTGRWAGCDMQLQNLAKPHEAIKDYEALLAATGDADAFRAALTEGVPFADGIASLIRPCLIPAAGHVLLIADFAGIEMRGAAWLANERSQLDAIERGEDVYCTTGTRLFGKTITKEDNPKEREIAKVAVLAAQYQMGASRFADECKKRGVDLAAQNLTAETVIEGYRKAVPAIAGVPDERGYPSGGLWQNLNKAARNAIIYGTAQTTNRCTFFLDNGLLVVILPSGRRKYYRHPRVEDYKVVFELPGREGDQKKALPGKGGFGIRKQTYGGDLTENLVQATCRDLLVLAMLQCERERLPIISTTHDEIICEVPAERGEDALRQLLEIMSTQPAWADGFPIEVEGFLSTRYAKKPIPQSPVRKARNGILI